MNQKILKTKVIIVGAGPTGLALACQLLSHDIDFIIIDKNEKTTHLSKAMVVHAKSLEIFSDIGLAEKAVSSGQILSEFSIIARGKIKETVHLSDFGEGLSPFPYVLTLEQSKTEKLMVDYLLDKGVNIHWNSSFINLEENEGSVKAYYKDKDGFTNCIFGDYLVGCDGAKSPVRQGLGLTFNGSTLENTFYVADVKVESEIINGKKIYNCLADIGFVLLFAMDQENHYRIIGVLPEHLKDKDDLSFSDVKQIIVDQLDLPISFVEDYWFSTYKAHSRMTENFSKGRCFLAGDSAHIHTPAGGQGMNTGIQDAYNLAWKLAYVIDNKSKPSLLDTYSEERTVISERLLKSTDEQFEILSGKSLVIRYLKQYVFPLAVKIVTSNSITSKMVFKMLSQIGIKYPDSSLTIKSKVGKIESGDRMPHFLINDKNIFDQINSVSYKLLIFGDSFEDNAFSNLDLEIFRFKDIPKFFKTKDSFLILLRPDNYIVYIGRNSKKIIDYFIKA